MHKVVFSKSVKFKGEYLYEGECAFATEEELQQLQLADVVAHSEEEKPKRQVKQAPKEEGE